MKLDLTEIAINLGKKHTYELNEPPLGMLSEEITSDKDITGELKFSNTGSVICVRGFFKTEILIQCSRCLEPYKLAINERIEEVLPIAGKYSSHKDPKDLAEDEEYLDDEDQPIFANNVFDMDELLRQNILVAAPVWAFCSEDCKGLCPSCGTNLNIKVCSCNNNEPNNLAFAKLSELLEDNQEN